MNIRYFYNSNIGTNQGYPIKKHIGRQTDLYIQCVDGVCKIAVRRDKAHLFQRFRSFFHRRYFYYIHKRVKSRLYLCGQAKYFYKLMNVLSKVSYYALISAKRSALFFFLWMNWILLPLKWYKISKIKSKYKLIAFVLCRTSGSIYEAFIPVNIKKSSKSMLIK